MAKKTVFVVVEKHRGRYRYLFGVFSSKRSANKFIDEFYTIKGLVALKRTVR